MALSQEQLDQAKILGEAIRQATDPTVTERLELQVRPNIKQVRRVPSCLSPTGGRFTAVIADSKTFPDFGRVVGIEDYCYPYSPEAEFAGLPVHREATYKWGTGANVLMIGQHNMKLPLLNREAKQTLALETYTKDLKDFVGKPFPAHLAPRPVEPQAGVPVPVAVKPQAEVPVAGVGLVQPSIVAVKPQEPVKEVPVKK